MFVNLSSVGFAINVKGVQKLLKPVPPLLVDTRNPGLLPQDDKFGVNLGIEY